MTTDSTSSSSKELNAFIQELSGFASIAEKALVQIESSSDPAGADFGEFCRQMIAIRGTADQLRLPRISRIAGLGEEISVKASGAMTRTQAKRCLGSLWDTLTTVKYMLEHPEEETSEEQEILTHRLETVLKQLGGRRPTIDEAEIERLLNNRGSNH